MSNNESNDKDEKSTSVPPCNSFQPQRWRKDVCAHCFHKKLEHAQSMLEGHVRKEDPTQVFELVELLGTGSFGSVYKCRDKKTKKTYAIKFLEMRQKGNHLKGIVNEINILKDSIECPYIVEYHGCWQKDDVLMVVMEYCEFSVADLLEYSLATRRFALSEEQIAALSAVMVKGLAYLHQRDITHRDVKPGNLLLSSEGGRLADFGISVELRHSKASLSSFAGSPYWLGLSERCAPEVITKERYDTKADVWGVGIAAIEMAEGRPPHWNTSPWEVLSLISLSPPPSLANPSRWSDEFVGFVGKCLQKNPKDRPSTKELLQDPFILKGSSAQILEALVREEGPALSAWKKQELRRGGAQIPSSFPAVGQTLAVNSQTSEAQIIASGVNLLRSFSSDSNLKTKRFFGVSLDTSSKEPVHLADHVMDFIEENLLDYSGIFCDPPLPESTIPRLKEAYEGVPFQLPSLGQFPPNDVAGLLKVWLLSLPAPLLSDTVVSKLAKVVGNSSEMSRILKEELSPPSLKVCERLCGLLQKVVSYSFLNGVTRKDLAQHFAPLLTSSGNVTVVEALLSRNNFCT